MGFLDHLISVGVQAGGKEAGATTRPFVVRLRRMFDKYCSGPYSTPRFGVALVLRIDGNVKH